MLEFTQFHVEYSRDCGYDRVDVFDGVFADPNFRIGGALCGYFNEPLYVTSSSNTLLVQMVTDHAIQRTGFTASYRIDVPELDPGGLPGYRIGKFNVYYESYNPVYKGNFIYSYTF